MATCEGSANSCAEHEKLDSSFGAPPQDDIQQLASFVQLNASGSGEHYTFSALYVSGSREHYTFSAVYASGSGEPAAPRRQSLLRSYLAARSFPRRPPA